MTLLTISQNIARDAKTSVPSSIIGNSQEVSRQLLSSIKLATNDIFNRHDWSVLQYDNVFNGVDLCQQYDLPPDFDRILNDTFFNSTEQREVILISPREWRLFNLNTNQSVVDRYRIRQNKIELLPIPTSTDEFVFEYISNLVILDDNGTTKYENWQDDTDTSLLNENLIELQARWRFLRMQGKEYAEAQREAEERFADIIGRDAGRRKIYPNMSLSSSNSLPRGINV